MDADARNPLDHGASAPQTILMRIMPKAGELGEVAEFRETSAQVRVRRGGFKFKFKFNLPSRVPSVPSPSTLTPTASLESTFDRLDPLGCLLFM
jgi:hypothetical protein